MTSAELKKLQDTLWQSADTLRADSGLKSSEYALPKGWADILDNLQIHFGERVRILT